MEKYATYKDVLDLANSFRYSQGFYGRLYRDLMEYDEDMIEDLNDILEKDKVEKDDLSIILWLEG